jgi:uncharacterized membrane protein YfcA
MTLPEYSILFWISAVAAVTLVGIAKAGFGGGVGVVATPLMALTISVTDAAALFLPLLIACDVFSLWHYRGAYSAAALKRLLPGAIAGIGAGTLFFGYFQAEPRILRIGIGLLALAFVGFQVFRTFIVEGMARKSEPTTALGVTLGALSGFASTLAHAGGPPVAVYLLPQKLSRDTFVGTSVVFFAVVNALKLIPYHFLGLIKMGNLTTILLLSPLTYVGVRLGIYLNRSFSDVWFNRVVYTILFLTGIDLVWGGNIITLIKHMIG